MNKEEKVVYLTDHIEKKSDIKIILDSHDQLNLTAPNSYIGKRVLAFGVDLLFIGLIKSASHAAYALFVNDFLAPLSSLQKSNLINGNFFIHAAIFIVIYCAYFLYTTYMLKGKTLGKMAMGLRVIDENFLTQFDQLSYTLSLKDSLRRSIGYLGCYLSFGTFFIFNFSSEDNRGLPDYLSNSRTVSDDWLSQMLEHKRHNAEIVLIDIHNLEQEAS